MLSLKQGEKVQWTFEASVSGGSSNPDVLKVTIQAHTVTMQTLKPGTATVSLSRADGSTVTLSVTVTA